MRETSKMCTAKEGKPGLQTALTATAQHYIPLQRRFHYERQWVSCLFVEEHSYRSKTRHEPRPWPTYSHFRALTLLIYNFHNHSPQNESGMTSLHAWKRNTIFGKSEIFLYLPLGRGSRHSVWFSLRKSLENGVRAVLSVHQKSIKIRQKEPCPCPNVLPL